MLTVFLTFGSYNKTLCKNSSILFLPTILITQSQRIQMRFSTFIMPSGLCFRCANSNPKDYGNISNGIGLKGVLHSETVNENWAGGRNNNALEKSYSSRNMYALDSRPCRDWRISRTRPDGYIL